MYVAYLQSYSSFDCQPGPMAPESLGGMPPAIREQSLLLDLQAPMPRTSRGEPERGMLLSSDPLSL